MSSLIVGARNLIVINSDLILVLSTSSLFIRIHDLLESFNLHICKKSVICPNESSAAFIDNIFTHIYPLRATVITNLVYLIMLLKSFHLPLIRQKNVIICHDLSVIKMMTCFV